MSIVLVFNRNDPSPWRELLAEKIPHEVIEIHPHVKNKDAVRFALCWKPEREVLLQYKNLTVVQSMGAGVDHILDTQTLAPHIQLARIVDHNLSNDMWEFLLAVVLQRIKNLPTYQGYQLQHKWRPHRYKTIDKTHVSIMGLGKIGEFVAKKFSDIGFKVSGWSSTKKSFQGIESYGGEELDLFLSTSDLLINLLPLTPETKGILNTNLFAKLKRGAYIINVGRGAHLVDNDLLAMLDSGHLSGALLDVFHNEPLPADHPFWNHSKIQITPHVASLTNFDSATDLIVENFKRSLSNQPLLHVVSQTKGY